jgi:calcium-dependent protein kinase
VAYIASNLQSQQEQKKLREIFREFDQNNDGVLERDELIAGYIKLGKSPTEAHKLVESIMARLDINNNGTIDYSEFLMGNVREEEVTSSSKLKQTFHLFDKVSLTLLRSRTAMDRLRYKSLRRC